MPPSAASFPSTYGLEGDVTASEQLTFYGHELLVLIYNASSRCDFNTMVLHYMMVMKCPQLLKVTLNAGLVADIKLQFLGLRVHLTRFLSIFYVRIFNNQGL
jgi:hypothetical protein